MTPEQRARLEAKLESWWGQGAASQDVSDIRAALARIDELERKLDGWDGEHEAGIGGWYHFKEDTVAHYEMMKRQIVAMQAVVDAARAVYEAWDLHAYKDIAQRFFALTQALAALDAKEKT